MKNIVYLLFALGISLQSINLTSGFFLYLSDLVIILFLFCAVVFSQKISFNYFSILTLFLSTYILLANLLNLYFEDDFSFISFINNYLKIITITLIIFLIPSFLKKIDLKIFFFALKYVLIFHSLIMVMDQYVVYPWGFENGLSFSASGEHEKMVNRSRGLFEEPSMYALYAGLTCVLILQYQTFLKLKIFNNFDYLIITLGFIAASSLTALIILLLIFINLIIINKEYILIESFQIRSILKIIPVILIGLPLIFFTLLNSFVYLSERITDSGNYARYIGSYIAIQEVFNDKPLLGIGLGGKNQSTFYDKKGFEERVTVFEYTDLEQTTSINTSFIFSLMAAGGVIALVLFYLLILSMIYQKETRILGILIFAIGFTKGNVFDLYLWLIISFSLYLLYQDKNIYHEK